MNIVKNTGVAVNFFDKYQGKIISILDAKEIKEKQQELIMSSFSEGLGQINDENQTEITSTLIQYLYRVDQGYFLNNPEDFQQEQASLFHLIHTGNLTDTNKIFYEYLIGLSRFAISIQLIYEYVKYINNDSVPIEIKLYSSQLYIQDNNYSLTTYLNRISTLSNIGKILISYLSDSYFQGNFSPEKYWHDVEQYFYHRHNIDLLARNLVSIQYVPENKRYLALMQSIHWQGFGGAGDILLKFGQFKELVVHSISHHNNYNTSGTFNKRLLVFKLPLESILARTQNLICEYLNSKFPTGVINIHDFCSGPKFVAVRAIIERDQQRRFNLTVSDIDGSSLVSLLNEKEKSPNDNLEQYEVHYEDLCLPLKIKEDQKDKYHLVNVNLGLHQLPIEEIYASIRYFAKTTKIGGLIANLDASERRYLQLMIIPGNLVDREGHVPSIEKMDLTKLIVSSLDDDYVRVAYPLVNLSKRVFIDLDPSIGVGPYMVSFYSPVIMKRKKFDSLHELWRLKKHDDCDRLVYSLTENIDRI